MTILTAALADYLRIRRSESVQFKKVGPALEHFVEFLEEHDAPSTSPSSWRWSGRCSPRTPATGIGRTG